VNVWKIQDARDPTRHHKIDKTFPDETIARTSSNSGVHPGSTRANHISLTNFFRQRRQIPTAAPYQK
jgi:hypothetical protein